MTTLPIRTEYHALLKKAFDDWTAEHFKKALNLELQVRDENMKTLVNSYSQ
ncbi:MAG: hypothetical protein K2X93_16380 [Candidatus Obscuribacterales bacterium]|nr:hypothetical protein [Candidatus Obscuribacterales bacterium]